MIEIREEEPGDIPAIREVNRRAFGQDHEARIVDTLRENGAATLSLVATLDDRLVGHILYSPVQVGGMTGAALGPMAVTPEHQRRGIGSRLVEAGHGRMKGRGCPFIIVIGHPEFYPRFGFTRAGAWGITCQWAVPDDVFMVLFLGEAAKRRVSGAATYRDEFSMVASDPGDGDEREDR